MRFHYMNAWVDQYDHCTVFRSYNTPILIKHAGHWFTSAVKYSASTSRQKNRFIHENNIKPVVLEHYAFVNMLREYDIPKGWA